MDTLRYLFGPVPSRRLGRSLGVNVIPSKICSMNCIYCEVGKTKALTTSRKPYIKATDIIKEFSENYARLASGVDVVTVTGAGEPTLNSELFKILNGIKSITDKPVAILTNSTTLSDKEVFDTLLGFDIVVPSLDSATEEGFKKVTLVHESVLVKDIIKDLVRFSKAYKGKLYLEILLCEGVNDSDLEIVALAEAAKWIRADKIQIGTIARPPAFSDAKQVDDEKILAVTKYFRSFGLAGEATGGFSDVYKHMACTGDLKMLIISITKMRPCTLEDFVAVFGERAEDVQKILDELLHERAIDADQFGGEVYYSHKSISAFKKGTEK